MYLGVLKSLLCLKSCNGCSPQMLEVIDWPLYVRLWLHNLSNMKAGCMALLDGLNLILQYGLAEHHILIESDAQTLVQMVLG